MADAYSQGGYVGRFEESEERAEQIQRIVKDIADLYRRTRELNEHMESDWGGLEPRYHVMQGALLIGVMTVAGRLPLRWYARATVELRDLAAWGRELEEAGETPLTEMDEIPNN